jgi:CheY-like chemotaxis protein
LRARQVLLNLLSNAVKFTAQGSISVGVSYLAANGGCLRISVTDTGTGIPPERLERLFQRFSQADGSISRKYGGTGLGLVICKSLTELMGGTIGMESQEGTGSTFWFTIAAPLASIATPRLALRETEWGGVAARILIVDDTTMNRELVSTMLSPFDHDMTEATNGAEAVEAAMHCAFDLILMDLQMPGMDGLAATRAIRETCELNRSTAIVALSANVLPEQVDACLAAGMNDHIGKPISPTELLTKVALWAGRAEDDAYSEANRMPSHKTS